MRRPATVLIIDDSELSRTRCRQILTEAGFRVHESGDGVEGLARYGELHPDAVLLDVNMPGMDGLKTMVEIRKQDPNARVAMLTAIGHHGQVTREAHKVGARRIITKPVKAAELVAEVQAMVGGSQQPAE